MSDIDIAVADSLKVLDLKRPIREADIPQPPFGASNGSRQYECKGRRLAPLIEISLLEWMSGILSKVRILPDD